MMGDRTVMQEALFYSFRIEDHVPADHLLRSIDRFVDLTGIREHLKPFYSETGRPSIDPELMIRMLIIGYCMGIRSERRLCEEVHLNLAYRWFCRLDLDGAIPDHSTFSKNRHGRFRDSDLLRKLFEMTVERCMAEGLVGGEGFAVDASLIRADVHRQRSVPGEEGLPPSFTALWKVSSCMPSDSLRSPSTKPLSSFFWAEDNSRSHAANSRIILCASGSRPSMMPCVCARCALKCASSSGVIGALTTVSQ